MSNRYMDWCPICSESCRSITALSEHMKSTHKRLILEKDINAQRLDREARLRQAEEAELITC